MNNFEMMLRRLEYQGGIKQEDRMIRDKYKTFQKALIYSYQGVDIILAQHFYECLSGVETEGQENFENNKIRALINPDRIVQDYDDKILSVDYKYNFSSGDVINWIGTNSYWIIYLKQLTEDAYFRGEIRRCKYKIKFLGQDGKNWYSTWAAIRGPVETQIQFIQKNQHSVDTPNLSLNILLPKNEKTIYAFNRYKEFLFMNRSWRVQAFDDISMVNVIQVAAEESYIDRDTDDTINEMKNGLIVEPQDPTPDSGIKGETWIKPAIPFIYEADKTGEWSILEKDYPVSILPLDGGNKVKVIWNKMSQGQFTLCWTNGEETKQKIIVVESLW